MRDRDRDVGLFRYALVRDPGDCALSAAERGALVRALAEREHAGPDGRPMVVGRSTLDRWIRAWREGGFEALCPRPRSVEPRTPVRTLALAEALKRELPERTAAQVRAVMVAAGDPAPSERTIQRHFARLGLNVRADGRPAGSYGRFEASAPNELWTGDGLHGPRIGGRRAILLAFIDDHSRALVGYRWGTGEDVVRLEAALRAGLAARGVPAAILVDRGSAFVSSQLARACAVLGIRLIHASPRAATTKGKVERFFRTVRDQFLVELGAYEVAGLGELNLRFAAWVEVVYHRREHSETQATPLQRFESGDPPRLPSPEELREAFLWSERRLVSKTATVSLHANQYEVDAELCGRSCELLFDPFDLERIEVRYQGRPLGLAVPVRINRHVHPKARPEAAPPPVPTAIDYLGLIAARRERELAGEPIDFAGLSEGASGRGSADVPPLVGTDRDDADTDTDQDPETDEANPDEEQTR